MKCVLNKTISAFYAGVRFKVEGVFHITRITPMVVWKIVFDSPKKVTSVNTPSIISSLISSFVFQGG